MVLLLNDETTVKTNEFRIPDLRRVQSHISTKVKCVRKGKDIVWYRDDVVILLLLFSLVVVIVVVTSNRCSIMKRY